MVNEICFINVTYWLSHWHTLKIFVRCITRQPKENSLFQFQLNPSSSIGGIVVKWFKFYRRSRLGAVTQKLSRQGTIRYPREHTHKNSAQSIQPFRRSCLDKIFWFWWLTDLVTDRHQKFLSDVQLDTLRKIPWRFRLNPSSRLGGVVWTRFFKQRDGWTDGQTGGI